MKVLKFTYTPYILVGTQVNNNIDKLIVDGTVNIDLGTVTNNDTIVARNSSGQLTDTILTYGDLYNYLTNPQIDPNDFIQNQFISPQTASFWIDGKVIVGSTTDVGYKVYFKSDAVTINGLRVDGGNSTDGTAFLVKNSSTQLFEVLNAGRVLVNNANDNGVDEFQVNGTIRIDLGVYSSTDTIVTRNMTTGQLTDTALTYDQITEILGGTSDVYIHNQIAAAQIASNYWISGRAIIGTGTDNLNDKLQVKGTVSLELGEVQSSDEIVAWNVNSGQLTDTLITYAELVGLLTGNNTYIRNQNSIVQTGTFNINGTGTLGSVITPNVDSPLTGGTDTLNIGTSNADVINIGWSGATVNIMGTRLWNNVTDLAITDKLIRLNIGGTASSGVSSGFEIEENGTATGYFATNSTRNGFDFKAGGSFQWGLNLSSLTTNRNVSTPDASGIMMLTNAGQTITNAIWNGTAIGVQYGGTGAVLSATGGTSQFVRQSSTGAAFTVSAITAADIPDLGTAYIKNQFISAQTGDYFITGNARNNGTFITAITTGEKFYVGIATDISSNANYKAVIQTDATNVNGLIINGSNTANTNYLLTVGNQIGGSVNRPAFRVRQDRISQFGYITEGITATNAVVNIGSDGTVGGLSVFTNSSTNNTQGIRNGIRMLGTNQSMIGIVSNLEITTALSQTRYTYFYANSGVVVNTSSVTTVDGFVVNGITGNATVTTAYGFRVQEVVNSSNTTTTAYGVYIDTISTSSTVTNRFGFYNNDTAAINVFRQTTLINTTTNNGTDRLQVSGTVSINLGTVSGTDTIVARNTTSGQLTDTAITYTSINTMIGGTSNAYIQNQIASAQATSNYWISGRGVIGSLDDGSALVVTGTSPLAHFSTLSTSIDTTSTPSTNLYLSNRDTTVSNFSSLVFGTNLTGSTAINTVVKGLEISAQYNTRTSTNLRTRMNVYTRHDTSYALRMTFDSDNTFTLLNNPNFTGTFRVIQTANLTTQIQAGNSKYIQFGNNDITAFANNFAIGGQGSLVFSGTGQQIILGLQTQGLDITNSGTLTNYRSDIRLTNTNYNHSTVGTQNSFEISNTINITGAASSTSTIFRGFYYNPTLTSIGSIQHRAWENTTGNVIVGSTSGNLLIGTTTDAGYRGYIVGSAGVPNGLRVDGGSTSTGDAILIKNASTNLYQALNAGRHLFGTPTDDGTTLMQLSGAIKSTSTLSTNFIYSNTTSGFGQINFGSTSNSPTTGSWMGLYNGTSGFIFNKTDNSVAIHAPTVGLTIYTSSGSSTLAALAIAGTSTTNATRIVVNAGANITGGASGSFNVLNVAGTMTINAGAITARGIYINPTLALTNATFYAWENTVGNVLVGTSSGNLLIGTSTDNATDRLQVSGTVSLNLGTVSGTDTIVARNTTTGQLTNTGITYTQFNSVATGSFINNQISAAQTTSNWWIDGRNITGTGTDDTTSISQLLASYAFTTGSQTRVLQSIRPTINNTGGTTSIIGIDYNPTVTSITGTTHLSFRSTAGRMLLTGTTGKLVVGATDSTADANDLIVVTNTNAASSKFIVNYNNSSNYIGLVMRGSTSNMNLGLGTGGGELQASTTLGIVMVGAGNARIGSTTTGVFQSWMGATGNTIIGTSTTEVNYKLYVNGAGATVGGLLVDAPTSVTPAFTARTSGTTNIISATGAGNIEAVTQAGQKLYIGTTADFTGQTTYKSYLLTDSTNVNGLIIHTHKTAVATDTLLRVGGVISGVTRPMFMVSADYKVTCGFSTQATQGGGGASLNTFSDGSQLAFSSATETTASNATNDFLTTINANGLTIQNVRSRVIASGAAARTSGTLIGFQTTGGGSYTSLTNITGFQASGMTNNTVTSVYGFEAVTLSTAAGTIANSNAYRVSSTIGSGATGTVATGYHIETLAVGTGVVTTGYGMYINSLAFSGGTMTTGYGIYIAAIQGASGTVTNKFGFYNNDTASINVFRQTTLINTTTNNGTDSLQVSGTVSLNLGTISNTDTLVARNATTGQLTNTAITRNQLNVNRQITISKLGSAQTVQSPPIYFERAYVVNTVTLKNLSSVTFYDYDTLAVITLPGTIPAGTYMYVVATINGTGDSGNIYLKQD